MTLSQQQASASGIETDWSSGPHNTANWSNPANWDNGVPGPGNDAFLDISNHTYNYDLSSSTIGSLTFNGVSQTLNLNGNSLTVSGALQIPLEGPFTTPSSSINLSHAGQLTAGSISNAGTLTLAGTVKSTGDFTNYWVTTVQNGGSLQVGGTFDNSSNAVFFGAGPYLTITGSNNGVSSSASVGSLLMGQTSLLEIDAGNNLVVGSSVVSNDGTLQFGGYQIGGTLTYTGSPITAIGPAPDSTPPGFTPTSVTLSGSGQFLTNGSNALATLQTLNGFLTLSAGASLTTNTPLNIVQTSTGGGSLQIGVNDGTSTSMSVPGLTMNLPSGSPDVSIDSMGSLAITGQGTQSNPGSFANVDSAGNLNNASIQNYGTLSYNGASLTTIGSNAALVNGGNIYNDQANNGGSHDALATLTTVNGSLVLQDAGHTFGSSQNPVVLTNSGFLEFSNGGQSAQSPTYTVNGSLINNGTLWAYDTGGTVQVNGTVTNTAPSNGVSGAHEIDIGNFGTMNATTLLNDTGAQMYLQNGTLNVAGTLTNNGGINSTFAMVTAGNFVNNATGTLTVNGNDGNFNVATANSVVVQNTLTNYGTLIVGGGVNGSAAGSPGEAPGGLLQVNNSGTAKGVVFSNNGTATFQAAQDIGSGAGTAIIYGAAENVKGGTFTVQGSPFGGFGATVTVQGAFANGAGSSLEIQGGSGIQAGSGGTMYAQGFTNNGTMLIDGGVSGGTDAGVLNLSYVTGNGTLAYGSYTQNGAASNTTVNGLLIAGGMDIMNGVFQVNGDVQVDAFDQNGDPINGLVDVNGGTLSGSGLIQGDVIVESNGTYGPGDPADLTIDGAFTMDGTMVEDFADPSTNSPAWDETFVNGASGNNGSVSFDGTLSIDLLNYVPEVGSYLILSWTGSAGAENLTLTNPNAGGLDWSLDWTGNQLFLVAAQGQQVDTPEPASLLLLGTGIASMLAAWRKRRHSSAHPKGTRL